MAWTRDEMAARAARELHDGIGHALDADLFLGRGQAAGGAHVLQPEADLQRQRQRVAHQGVVVDDQDLAYTVRRLSGRAGLFL